VARVVINPDWERLVMPAWVDFAESRLGPDIADDARKFCPVDTGALKASIEDHMEEVDLIVSASGGGEDENGNLYVSRRPGKLSASGTHPGADQARHVGTAVTREVHFTMSMRAAELMPHTSSLVTACITHQHAQ
jgi:hypothetical protein